MIAALQHSLGFMMVCDSKLIETSASKQSSGIQRPKQLLNPLLLLLQSKSSVQPATFPSI